ncbi:hypothetical protein [Campylobacter sp.]|nr:hypothetical protein [Campylobacter sp.]
MAELRKALKLKIATQRVRSKKAKPADKETELEFLGNSRLGIQV